MIPTDDIKAQYALLHHGRRDEQIARLKHKLLFWRVVGIVNGMFIVAVMIREFAK